MFDRAITRARATDTHTLARSAAVSVPPRWLGVGPCGGLLMCSPNEAERQARGGRRPVSCWAQSQWAGRQSDFFAQPVRDLVEHRLSFRERADGVGGEGHDDA